VQYEAAGVRVSIRRAVGNTAVSYALPYAEGRYDELTQGNSWLEAEDPFVRQLSREATAGATDALTAARRIESHVREFIALKDMSMGMATAAETVRQKAGDCTEHALLVAALARAAGMPSRVVGGLAYAERLPGQAGGGFGYHMWAEVYVGEWLPLDAALGGHDATHLALTRSSLNGPSDPLLLSSDIARFLGRIRIQVLPGR